MPRPPRDKIAELTRCPVCQRGVLEFDYAEDTGGWWTCTVCELSATSESDIEDAATEQGHFLLHFWTQRLDMEGARRLEVCLRAFLDTQEPYDEGERP